MHEDSRRGHADSLHAARSPIAVARLLIDTGPLRHSRQFRRLWTGYVFRQLGAELTATAVIYQTYVITHSNLDVGFVSLAQLGPAIFIPIVSGAITDAVDRRKVLLVTALLIGATTAGLAINASRIPSSLVAGLRLRRRDSGVQQH